MGLTDILESSGLSGIPALSVWRCFPLSYACLSPAVPQLVDSGPHFRTDVYATWLSPGFAQILFRIADSSVLPLAPVSLLFHCFLDSCNVTNQTRNWDLLFVSFALSTYLFGGMAADLLAWYLVGLPIGPGIYPRLSKRERMLRLLEEKIATPLGPRG